MTAGSFESGPAMPGSTRKSTLRPAGPPGRSVRPSSFNRFAISGIPAIAVNLKEKSRECQSLCGRGVLKRSRFVWNVMR
jgi:hypothetical protein